MNYKICFLLSIWNLQWQKLYSKWKWFGELNWTVWRLMSCFPLLKKDKLTLPWEYLFLPHFEQWESLDCYDFHLKPIEPLLFRKKLAALVQSPLNDHILNSIVAYWPCWNPLNLQQPRDLLNCYTECENPC